MKKLMKSFVLVGLCITPAVLPMNQGGKARGIKRQRSTKSSTRSVQNNPLHEAAFSGRTEALKTLLSQGAYPDAVFNGKTPLQVACMQGHLSEMLILAQYGANIKVQTSLGESLWDLAATSSKPHFYKSFEIIFGPSPVLVESRETLGASSSGLTSSGSGSTAIDCDIENLEMKEFAAPYVLSTMKKRGL